MARKIKKKTRAHKMVNTSFDEVRVEGAAKKEDIINNAGRSTWEKNMAEKGLKELIAHNILFEGEDGLIHQVQA